MLISPFEKIFSFIKLILVFILSFYLFKNFYFQLNRTFIIKRSVENEDETSKHLQEKYHIVMISL